VFTPALRAGALASDQSMDLDPPSAPGKPGCHHCSTHHRLGRDGRREAGVLAATRGASWCPHLRAAPFCPPAQPPPTSSGGVCSSLRMARCVVPKARSFVERHIGTNPSCDLRVIYMARKPDCAVCPLRTPCLGRGEEASKPRRVSAVFPRRSAWHLLAVHPVAGRLASQHSSALGSPSAQSTGAADATACPSDGSLPSGLHQGLNARIDGARGRNVWHAMPAYLLDDGPFSCLGWPGGSAIT
jgi:hypothetical protein